MRSRLVGALLACLFVVGCGSSELTGQFDRECNDPTCAVAPGIDSVVEEPAPFEARLADRRATESVDLELILPPDDEELPLPDPEDGPDLVQDSDLSEEDHVRVAVLRDSISIGLDEGRVQYLEEVEVTLHTMGIIEAYEMNLVEGHAGLDGEVAECPFVENLGNGFDSTGTHCDYLAEVAKVEVYSELAEELAAAPLPADILATAHAAEASFWYEQGAISGVEEGRVQVRFDMKDQQLCDREPTPLESSYDKGVAVGRRLFAAEVNEFLASRGVTPDYPEMSDPIEVCNANQIFLEPARQSAIQNIANTVEEQPLCDGYSPPTQELSMQYSQAEIDYEHGIRAGISDEFALAIVKVFVVISCVVADPLVVDLDGDGFELTSIEEGLNFDMRADGSPQATAWTAPDDGFLAMDRNGNGKIDSGAELFGNTERDFEDGFEDLAQLDANGDGFITALDPGFAQLVIWQDVDFDGLSTRNELTTVSSFGIERIPTAGTSSSLVVGGNAIPVVAEMTGSDISFSIGDALLRTAPYPRLVVARR